jgi:hypothetical protein
MLDTGKTVTVLGKKYPVMLDNDGNEHAYRGMYFVVDLGDGQELRDREFAKLDTRAREFKDVRFDLPFTTDTGKDGSVTGFHAGNGRMLVRWSDGKTSQESPYGLNRAMPRLSGEDRANFEKLWQDRLAAYEAVERFVDEHKFPEGTEAAAIEARVRKAGLA